VFRLADGGAGAHATARNTTAKPRRLALAGGDWEAF
jgi:hypothetical protein